MTNPILNTDSYKTGHYKMYPEGTEYVSSYIEARKGPLGWDPVFLGLQPFLIDYLQTPITQENIDEADEVLSAHGVPFNREGWEYILAEHDGFLPVRIEALPEGTPCGIGTCLVQVVNTDPKVPWITSYVETALLRAVWYPTTVATLSREAKKLIKKYMLLTAGHTEGIDFMLHDFGARGVSSRESADVGGLAHIVNFMGTDTLTGILAARRYYGAEGMPAFSVAAMEHSTVTSWGRDGEVDAYRNMIQNAGEGQIVSIVSDSYDIWNTVDTIYGETLRADILALADRGGRLVVRPDSGDATVVPVDVVEKLMESFGYTTNNLGFKVLPPFLRVLQGDGINYDSMQIIMQNAMIRGISTENFVFGMGGGLLQQINRDTLSFAMKASAICVNGEWRDVYKDPIGGSKPSKKGRLAVAKWNNESEKGWTYETFKSGPNTHSELVPIFENGKILKTVTFAELRENAKL